MQVLRNSLRVYFVMGSTNCKQDPRHVLRAAIRGGITFFQFREKGVNCLHSHHKRELAKDLQAICREFNIPFIVNDDIELAIELDADGVHIGQEDQSIVEVRKLIGDKIIGVSTHSVEEAETAVLNNADYIGVGPMYLTTTKTDVREVQGPQLIRKMRNAGIGIPIVGIGGITQSLAKEVICHGADGIAIISAISQADDPEKAVQSLLHDTFS